MIKISSTQIKEVLSETSDTLRKLASENIKLQEKVAHFEKKEECEKLAMAMEEKGIKPELSREEKIAELMETDKNLEVIKQALELEPKTMKLASLDSRNSVSLDPFTSLVDFLRQ